MLSFEPRTGFLIPFSTSRNTLDSVPVVYRYRHALELKSIIILGNKSRSPKVAQCLAIPALLPEGGVYKEPPADRARSDSRPEMAHKLRPVARRIRRISANMRWKKYSTCSGELSVAFPISVCRIM